MDFPPNLNGNKTSNKYSKPHSLDLIDLRIISMLCNDSNTPFVEIARNIGISDATVHMRVKRLMVEGIIRKFTIVGMITIRAFKTVGTVDTLVGILAAHNDITVYIICGSPW